MSESFTSLAEVSDDEIEDEGNGQITPLQLGLKFFVSNTLFSNTVDEASERLVSVTIGCA